MFEGTASRILLLGLVDVSIKAAMVALSVLLVLLLMRVKDGALRHAAWATVLWGMLTLPIWITFLPAVAIPIGPWETLKSQGSTMIVEAASGGLLPVSSRAEADASGVTASRTDHTAQSGSFSWLAYLAVFYLTVSIWMLCRLILSLVMSRRVLRRARLRLAVGSRWLDYCQKLAPARFLRDAPTLWSSPAVRVPATTGWLRPKILLPAGWEQWTEQKLEAVLAHEAAHVRRGDYLYQILGALNRCIYWFHPLAWVLPRHLSTLAEQACDADAVRNTRNRALYASYLLEIAASLGRKGERVSMAYLTMARSSQIGSRIDTILAGEPTRRFGRVMTTALYLLAASLCLGVATLRLEAGTANLTRAGAPPAAKGLVIAKGPFTDISSLKRAWELSAAEAARRGIQGGFWIGYAVERPAGAVAVIGSDSQPGGNDSFVRSPGGRRGAAGSGRVGFFFRLPPSGSTSEDVTRIKVDDLSATLDLGGETLFWLGAWPDADSLSFLQTLSEGLPTNLRKEIPLAVALHAQAGERSAERLVETFRSDPSMRVRKEAVQSLGVLGNAQAVAALIDLARTAGSAEIRREAVFQLGIQRSREAANALAAIVYDDSDLEVQKEALDALARSHGPGAREVLAEIADRHPNRELRAEARELLQRGKPPLGRSRALLLQ